MTDNTKTWKFPRNLNIDKIVGIGLTILVLTSVFVIVFVVFIPVKHEGFSELSLYVYRDDLETYITYGYPAGLYTDRNESIFFVVRNFEDKATYYQIQIKLKIWSQKGGGHPSREIFY